MDPAIRYRLTKAGTVHNLYPPASCQVDTATTRTGTPAQLKVFAGEKELNRCQRCAGIEAEAAEPAPPTEPGPTAPMPPEADQPASDRPPKPPPPPANREQG